MVSKLGWAVIVCCGLTAVVSAEEPDRTDRVLATRRPYPAGRADDVRRPGFNGRLWIGRPIIGGVAPQYPLDWADPGPAAYGAPEYDFPLAFVNVGTEVVGISPWESINEGGLSRLEHGRQQWLADQGYVGGVRTFINDKVLLGLVQQQAAKDPEPRATFEWPLDQPRFRNRQQVHNEQGSAPLVTLQSGDRVSWPMHAPAPAIARTDAVAAATKVASTK